MFIPRGPSRHGRFHCTTMRGKRPSTGPRCGKNCADDRHWVSCQRINISRVVLHTRKTLCSEKSGKCHEKNDGGSEHSGASISDFILWRSWNRGTSDIEANQRKDLRGILSQHGCELQDLACGAVLELLPVPSAFTSFCG